MEFLNIIKSRRSTRDYKTDAPVQSDIRKILEAGRWAPSGLNNQPWRFMVIKKIQRKNGLAAFTECGDIIRKAPVVIAVCLDLKESYHRDKDLMAVGACVQNMLLEAHALGLGTCWLGEILNRGNEAARYLNLDRKMELAAVIALGYPGKSGKSRRKALQRLLIKDT